MVMILAMFVVLLVGNMNHIAKSEKTEITVMNRLEEGRTLITHCQSGDDDMGIVAVVDGHDMSWSFHLNFWGTTLFYCMVRWDGSDGWSRFDAYDEARDSKRCIDCKWMFANDGGLYGFEQDIDQWKQYSLKKD